MKVRVTVKSVETYHRLSFVFSDMETATIFMDTAMHTAERDVEFELVPVHEYQIEEEKTEEGEE